MEQNLKDPHYIIFTWHDPTIGASVYDWLRANGYKERWHGITGNKDSIEYEYDLVIWKEVWGDDVPEIIFERIQPFAEGKARTTIYRMSFLKSRTHTHNLAMRWKLAFGGATV